VTESYGHLVPGFEPAELQKMLRRAGLTVETCEVTSRERKKPYFEVISAFARKEERASARARRSRS
jgi:ArsR family transcriptional regulator